jgi:hypothetical protein
VIGWSDGFNRFIHKQIGHPPRPTMSPTKKSSRRRNEQEDSEDEQRRAKKSFVEKELHGDKDMELALLRRDVEVEKLRGLADMARKDEELARKDEALARKDEALARKDEELARKDEELARKDEALARKDEALARKDEEMEKLHRLKDEELARKGATIIELESKAKLAENDADHLRTQLAETKDELMNTKDELINTEDELYRWRDEAQKLKEETIRLTQTMDDLKDMVGGSPGQRFDITYEKATITNGNDIYPWPPAKDERVMAAWKNVQKLPIDEDDTGYINADEVNDLQPDLKTVIDTAAPELYNRDQVISSFQGKYINGMIPDLSVTQHGLVRPTNDSAFVVVEVKTKDQKYYKGGIIEALDYMRSILKRRQTYDGKFSGLYMSFRSICALHLRNHEMTDLVMTDVLDLFPPGWKTFAQPTPGFRVLCHSLMVVSSSAPLPMVKINEQYYTVCDILCVHPSTSTSVYGVQMGNDEIAVKIGPKRKIELDNYRRIVSSSKMRNFVMPVLENLNVENGFVMPKAELLSDWLQVRCALLKRAGGINAKKAVMVEVEDCVINLLRACLILYDDVKMIHGDVRVENLVMFEGCPRIIDWVTACPRDETPFNESRVPPRLIDLIAMIKSICISSIVLTEKSSALTVQHYLKKTNSENPVVRALARIHTSIVTAGFGHFNLTEDWIEGCRSFFWVA